MWRRQIIVVGLAVMLAGCGGTDSSETTAPASETTAPSSETTDTTSAPTTEAAVATTVAATNAAASPEHVTFPASDGVTLEGTVFGSGGDVVVLGAMGLSEMETWFPFAEVLAEEGYTALAYNMRGHGESGGDQFPFRVDIDAQAAVDFMASRGTHRIFFIGASVNGVGAVAAGAQNDLAGVVVLSGVSDVDGVNAVTLAPQVSEPKLFIVADGDGDVPGLMGLVVDAAPEPKSLTVFSGSAHGTDLFGTHGEELTTLLLDFLASN